MQELQEFIDQLKKFELADELITIGKEINQLKVSFEDFLLETERKLQIEILEAREKGETIEPVDFTDIKNAFFEGYKELQAKRKIQISLKDTLEKENLRLKKELLDRIRKVIESEENISTAFQAYKELHETWKKIGDIPRDQRDAIQKEYSRLIEIFFYTMRIYREIKDHDYKRNLQLKQNIIHKLQQLRNQESEIREVEQQLRTLQDEWEEIGPVANDLWEQIKTSYWETVRSIYEKINVHYEAQRQVFVQNIESKKSLVAAVNQLVEEAKLATQNKEWDRLTEAVVTQQEAWKKIGPGSRKENEVVWKEFRKACDEFFNLKKEHNKAQNEVFTQAANQKKTLIEKAKSFHGATDWKTASHNIIQLQKDWKTIGFAGKIDNKLWSEFRAACDVFFNAREEANKSQDLERVENANKKKEIIQSIMALETTDKRETLVALKDLAAAFAQTGPAPHNHKENLYAEFKKALDDKYNSLSLDAKEKDEVLFKSKLDGMFASPDRAKLLQREKSEIRKQIEKIQQESNQMENNLAFFAKSKGADALRADVDKKVAQANREIEKLKNRLKLIPNE